MVRYGDGVWNISIILDETSMFVCYLSSVYKLLVICCSYLVRLVKEQTEVCKNNPQLLPSISCLEFPKQFTTHLILKQHVESISEFFPVTASRPDRREHEGALERDCSSKCDI